MLWIWRWFKALLQPSPLLVKPLQLREVMKPFPDDPSPFGHRGRAGGAGGEGCSRQMGLGSGAQDKEEMETSLEVQWLGL